MVLKQGDCILSLNYTAKSNYSVKALMAHFKRLCRVRSVQRESENYYLVTIEDKMSLIIFHYNN